MPDEIGGHDRRDNHRCPAADGRSGQVRRDNQMTDAAPADEHAGGHERGGDQRTYATGSGVGHHGLDTPQVNARPATDPERRGHVSDDTHEGIAAAGGEGQHFGDAHGGRALPASASNGGQVHRDNHAEGAPVGEAGGQQVCDSHQNPASGFASELSVLIESDHKYSFWVRQTTALTNRLKGMGRRLYHAANPDATLTDIRRAGVALYEEVTPRPKKKRTKNSISSLARMLELAEPDTIEALEFAFIRREYYQAQIERIALLSPVAEWWCSIKGCRELGLGRVLAALGPGDPDNGKVSLDNYDTVSKVRKRMGLACNPDGTRQRKVRGAGGKDQGFNPHRCAVFFGFVDSMFKAQGKGETALDYRKVYDARRARMEAETDWTKTHLNNDARRIMAKRLLRDLWRAWRRANQAMAPTPALPAVEFPEAAE